MLDSNYTRLVEKIFDTNQRSMINSPIKMGVSTALLLLARQYASAYYEGGRIRYDWRTTCVYARYANKFCSLRAGQIEGLMKDKISERKGVTVKVNFPLVDVENPLSGSFHKEFIKLIKKFFFVKEEETKEVAYSPTNFGGQDDYSIYTMESSWESLRKIEERNLKPVYDGKVGGIPVRKEDIIYRTFYKYCLLGNVRVLKINFVNPGWLTYKSVIGYKFYIEWIKETIINKFPKSIRENIQFYYEGKDLFPPLRKEELKEVYLEDTLNYLYQVLDIPMEGILESLKAYGITPDDNPKLQFLKLQFGIFGEDLFPEYVTNKEELIEALRSCGSTHYADKASSIPEVNSESFYEDTSYDDEDEDIEVEDNEEESELVW